jgi:uncharacterized protein (TIGR03435 family)
VTFDVASIRRNKMVEDQRAALPPTITVYPARAQTLRGGLLRARGMSVNELIRDAYGYRNRPQSDIVNAPKWILDERYDVEAKASINFPPSTSVGLPPAGQAALRALLAERFNLKVRLEVQRRPVYELIVRRADRRLGPHIVPSKGGCISYFQREPVNVGLVIDKPAEGQPEPLRPCYAENSYWNVVVENMTLPEFAIVLQTRAHINRPVIDRTGLTGSYDITVRANPEPGDLVIPFKPVLESELGLTVRDAEAPIEVLVIEHIDHPTEN